MSHHCTASAGQFPHPPRLKRRSIAPSAEIPPLGGGVIYSFVGAEWAWHWSDILDWKEKVGTDERAPTSTEYNKQLSEVVSSILLPFRH